MLARPAPLADARAAARARARAAGADARTSTRPAIRLADRPDHGAAAGATAPAAPDRAAPVRVLLTVVAALLLLAGCAVSVDSGGGGDSGGSGGSSSDNPLDSVNRNDLDGDERDAADATNAFWRQVFPEDFRQSYTPPQVRGGYVGEDGPSCGGQPSVRFNAFYCPSQDFLAWDENLMAAGYRQIGDAWVYLIIAHEWGHAIQARLRADQVSVAAELQADCFAGATLFGAADRGLLTFERGDIQELRQTLVAVADDFPWTKESDHGDARQRIDAFNQGAQGDPTSCTRQS
jgi:uncharacterized protein